MTRITFVKFYPSSGLDNFSHGQKAKIYPKGGEQRVVKTIYTDVLFLINLIINYLILFCTAHICSARIKKWRLISAAALGAVHAVLLFVFPFLTSPVAKLSISSLMVFIAFGKKKLLRRFLVFLATTLAFGGMVFALSALLRSDFFEATNGVYYIHISLPVLLFGVISSYLLLTVIFRRRISDSPEKITELKIISGTREISLLALRDTGNSLRTSDNAPIVISDYKSLREIFPDNAKKLLDASHPKVFPLLLDKLSDCGDFSLIPTSSVGAEFSLLLSFRPDRIEFEGIADSGARIALSPARISGGEKYSAIY